MMPRLPSPVKLRLVLPLLLCACAPPARVEIALRVPPADHPLAVADSVSLAVRDSGGDVVALSRAPASSADLSVSGISAGSYTVEIDATFDGDVVARGTSCAFTVTQPPYPTVPVWLSRVGEFAATGGPRLARDGGSVFAIGGSVFIAGGSVGGIAQASSERYDVSTSVFSPGPALATPRAGAVSIVSSDGSVILVGGAQAGQPGVETFAAARSVPQPAPFPPDRVDAAGVRLGDGDALVAGGRSPGTMPVADAFLLGNDGASLDNVGSLVHPRAQHTLTLAGSGRFAAAIAIGGSDGSAPIADIEIYDPEQMSFILAGAQLTTPRAMHTTTLLPTGELLVIGGVDVSGMPVATAEIFDPGTRTVRASGALRLPRSQHTATLLPSGRVLVSGGVDASGNPTSSAELFDPALGADGDFVPTQSLTEPRAGHALAPLCDGTFLVTGGGVGAEIYNPL